MTRKVFIVCTLLFWLAVGGFWAISEQAQQPSVAVTPPSTTSMEPTLSTAPPTASTETAKPLKSPEQPKSTPVTQPFAPSAPTNVETPSPAPAPAAVSPENTNKYTLAQIARHDTAQDCWMAIDGKVYDLTAYAPNHPSAPDIFLAWCGKEASAAYATKTRGRSHSARADKLLAKYLVGTL